MALDAERAAKPIRKLRKLLNKMPAEPSADDIHDFRTSSRRIEATIHSLSLDSGQNGRRVWKQISKLRKRAGKVRDMDVLTDYLSKVSRHREKETGCKVRLLEHLGAQRLKYARKFERARQQCAPELNKRLKRTARQMDKFLPKTAIPSPTPRKSDLLRQVRRESVIALIVVVCLLSNHALCQAKANRASSLEQVRSALKSENSVDIGSIHVGAAELVMEVNVPRNRILMFVKGTPSLYLVVCNSTPVSVSPSFLASTAPIGAPSTKRR